MGNSIFTLEQFSTLLAQVEAVLNSRPLYARSSDPVDFQPPVDDDRRPRFVLVGHSVQSSKSVPEIAAVISAFLGVLES